MIARKYAFDAIGNDGFVHKAEAIYADIEKSKRLAFLRRGVPILPLLFLYEQVVIYIPPCSQEDIFLRFGISWEVLRGLY